MALDEDEGEFTLSSILSWVCLKFLSWGKKKPLNLLRKRSQNSVSDHTFRVELCSTYAEWRIYCNLKWRSPWVSNERKSVNRALFLKNRQNVQDLKLWHQKVFVSFFLPTDYSFKWGKRGDEPDGTSVFWGRVQLACSFTWLSEPISGRRPWASLPSHSGWDPPGSSRNRTSPEGSSANLERESSMTECLTLIHKVVLGLLEDAIETSWF